MKTIAIVTFFIAACALHAEEKSAVKAESGRFEVTQEYQVDSDFREIVRFRDKSVPPVRLSGFCWPGNYSISPNERWLLRIQKTGSGASAALLYRMEENGRVSEVMGFDDLLWHVSDTTSRLKKAELYHTGINSFKWSQDHFFLEIVLRGSNTEVVGDDIECRIRYDLRRNKATIQKARSEPAVEGKP